MVRSTITIKSHICDRRHQGSAFMNVAILPIAIYQRSASVLIDDQVSGLWVCMNPYKPSLYSFIKGCLKPSFRDITTLSKGNAANMLFLRLPYSFAQILRLKPLSQSLSAISTIHTHIYTLPSTFQSSTIGLPPAHTHSMHFRQ